MIEPQHVFVTGGGGYVGSVLVPKLLHAGHSVTVLDCFYFGEQGLAAVAGHPQLTIIRGDIRDVALLQKALVGQQAVIHLACLANDPSFELNPQMGKEINFDCFAPLVQVAKHAGVSRFIYASTSSVYGVSDAPDVTEDAPLVPLTDYNKYKGLCEPILLQEASATFAPTVIRCATVCGYSPRLRLDLSVNIFANHAYHLGKVTILGGEQRRPNIHVEDITDLYAHLLTLPMTTVSGKVWNAGAENATIADIAKRVVSVVGLVKQRSDIVVEIAPSNDKRSYHISSERIRRDIGFLPKRTIEDAVRDVVAAFDVGKVPDALEDPRYYNIRTMKALEERMDAPVALA